MSVERIITHEFKEIIKFNHFPKRLFLIKALLNELYSATQSTTPKEDDYEKIHPVVSIGKHQY